MRSSPDDVAAVGEEGRDHRGPAAGDEAFEGYWNRPDANAKALRDGWYFTGDTGYFDADGDLFVTGRVDDMIITGGENISPVEIERCLSLHPAVDEVAVGGRAGRALGPARGRPSSSAANTSMPEGSTRMCRAVRPRRTSSGRADYVFVDDIPKSPVGKMLRRKLVKRASTRPIRSAGRATYRNQQGVTQ